MEKHVKMHDDVDILAFAELMLGLRLIAILPNYLLHRKI